MANVYNISKDGNFDWTSVGITAALADATYTYDADHTSMTDIGAAELSGTGYARLTSGFTGRTVTINNTLDRAEFYINPFNFAALAADNATPAHLIVFFTGSGNLLLRAPTVTPDAPDGNLYRILPQNVDANGILFFLGDNP